MNVNRLARTSIHMGLCAVAAAGISTNLLGAQKSPRILALVLPLAAWSLNPTKLKAAMAF